MKQSSFWERKLQRSLYFYTFVYGWKQKDCSACNGSGYYDVFNSPKCGACNGTRKELYLGEKALVTHSIKHIPFSVFEYYIEYDVEMKGLTKEVFNMIKSVYNKKYKQTKEGLKNKIDEYLSLFT